MKINEHYYYYYFISHTIGTQGGSWRSCSGQAYLADRAQATDLAAWDRGQGQQRSPMDERGPAALQP